MKITIKSVALIFGVFSISSALAQEHTLTYTKKFKPVGASFNIAGEPYQMVRIPVRDIGTGNKYSIDFAAPSTSGIFTAGTVITSHRSLGVDFPEPNTTIGAFPAWVRVDDGIAYTLTADGIGGHNFLVTGSVSVSVAIDIGETTVQLINTFEMRNKATGEPPLTSVATGASLNAVPFATWAQYTDPNSLITALDKWIDYIRVTAL